MTNEIKEILDLFYNEYPKEEKIIEKYITNLQENHCDYKEKCNEYNVGCIKEILCNYQKTNNNLQQRIDKANNILNKLVVIEPWENTDDPMRKIYRPIKNTTKQEVYRAIVELENILRGDE